MINIEHIKKCEIFSQDETDAQVLIIHLYSSKQHTDALCREKKSDCSASSCKFATENWRFVQY